MRLDNGQTAWLQPDPSVGFSGTSFTSTASSLSGFPDGQMLVTAYVNGIPSASSVALMYVPTVPYTPTNVTASIGNGNATVTFDALFDGNSLITEYVVTSNPITGSDGVLGARRRRAT